MFRPICFVTLPKNKCTTMEKDKKNSAADKRYVASLEKKMAKLEAEVESLKAEKESLKSDKKQLRSELRKERKKKDVKVIRLTAEQRQSLLKLLSGTLTRDS